MGVKQVSVAQTLFKMQGWGCEDSHDFENVTTQASGLLHPASPVIAAKLCSYIFWGGRSWLSSDSQKSHDSEQIKSTPKEKKQPVEKSSGLLISSSHPIQSVMQPLGASFLWEPAKPSAAPGGGY